MEEYSLIVKVVILPVVMAVEEDQFMVKSSKNYTINMSQKGKD